MKVLRFMFAGEIELSTIWRINWAGGLTDGLIHVSSGTNMFLDLTYLSGNCCLIITKNGCKNKGNHFCPKNAVLMRGTGTRLNIGRPQPRWQYGIELAKAVLAERPDHQRGSSFLRIGTLIQRARDSLINSWNSFNSVDNTVV